MKYLTTAFAALLLAGCGQPTTTPPAATATPAETSPAPAAPATAAAEPAGAAVPVGTVGTFKEGAEGCRDKAKSKEAWEASHNGQDAKAMRIWADGMQDQSCRAFGTTLGATATSVDPDGWICATPADDEKGACYWVAPGKVG